MKRSLQVLAIWAATLALSGSAVAQSVGADLNISPRRLVFGETGRAATAYLFNQGDKPAEYRIELADAFMTADGEVLKASEAGADPARAALLARVKSARPFVIVTPRRITLQPHESQVVRLRMTAPPDLPPGEYRTHLVVTALPPEDVGLTAEQAAGVETDKVSVKVVALYSLSIPVIVRQGAADARGHVENLRLADPRDRQTLAFDLVRDGASSLFGDLEVRDVKAGKNAAPLAALNSVAVYPEIDRRRVTLRLAKPVAAGERLVVTYKDDDARAGAVLATDTLTAQ